MNLDELIASPEALGMDGARLKRVDALVEGGVADGTYPAATYIVMRHGRIAAQGAFGFAQPDGAPPIPTVMSTIFDMASVSKTVTATLLLQCIEDGLFHLGNTVGYLLPEAEGKPVGTVSLRQLATHTSGLPAWKQLYKTELGSALEEILATDLESEPGTHYTYSDLGYITIGEILKRVTGKPLDALASDRIFKPLRMDDSGYTPDALLKPRIAATANCPWREGKTLIGEVHDANCHFLDGVSGHAGLFSSALDVARYAVSLRRQESPLNLPPLLGPLATRLAERSQIPPEIGGHSIGWFAEPSGYLPRGDLLSERTYGHTGFTGTHLMFDPDTDLTLILLTNRVYASFEGRGILGLRRLFANLVGAAVVR